MKSRHSYLTLLLVGLAACSETPPPPPLPPGKPTAEAPPPAEAPVARMAAPKALAGLAFFAGSVDACEHASLKPAETEARPLKVGLIPTTISPALANDLTAKTRVWKVESSPFDFYRILSGNRPDGLRPNRPALGCIRYSMTEEDGASNADMTFSVTYDPKTPEVLSVMPVRLHYRHGGAGQAAMEVALSLKTYALERNSGRVATSLQNQEMAVEIFQDPGADIAYDPVNGPSIVVPLPAWDYSAKSDNPRHNLSVLALTVTEIADFDWLQSQTYRLWPSWEYEATDVAKIRFSSEYYSHTHAP